MDADRWTPISVEAAVELFAAAPFRWWISGGHALDLHLGEQWRPHDDLDIGVCRFQASLAYAWLRDWELHIAADGRLSLWEGGPLEHHRHENNVWARRSPGAPWSFDLTVGEGERHMWIYRRDRSVTRPWDEAVFRTSSGVPYLAPELQLLFKSKHHQPKDHLDAEQVIPTLGATEQAFLAAQIGVNHPWQRLLTR